MRPDIDRIFGKEFLCVNLMKRDVLISKICFQISYACFDTMSSCPHMDGPYGQSTAFGLFCLLWHQLATTNQHILCIFLILETQPHNSCLNSFPEISRTSVSEVAALPAPFFLGQSPQTPVLTQVLSPKIARRAERDRAGRVEESSGQGCRRTGCTRGGATGGVLVGKSARPPLKRGLAAAAALPWTLSAPRVSPLCRAETCVSFVCSSRPADATL